MTVTLLFERRARDTIDEQDQHSINRNVTRNNQFNDWFIGQIKKILTNERCYEKSRDVSSTKCQHSMRQKSKSIRPKNQKKINYIFFLIKKKMKKFANFFIFGKIWFLGFVWILNSKFYEIKINSIKKKS